MTWSINYVDFDVLTFGATPVDSCVFRENCDALLAFKIHRIEDAVSNIFVVPKGPRLPKHRVNQRGLAVVDMRDNSDVS